MRRRVTVRLTSPRFPVLAQTVQPKTLRDYRRALGAFSAFLGLSRSATTSIAALDNAFASFLNFVLIKNGPVAHVRNSFCGLRLFNGALDLPLTYSIYKRVDKLRPSRTRTPLTWSLTVLLASHCLLHARRHRFQLCVGLLVIFDCYLRVNELLRLRREDIGIPVDADLDTAASLPILRLQSTKTSLRHWQQVQVQRPVVAQLLVRLAAETSPGERLFPFSADVLNRALRGACEAWGLQPFTAHCGRHGGPTHDLIHGRTMKYIVERGRWASFKSCQRYLHRAQARSLELLIYVEQARLGASLAPHLLRLAEQHHFAVGGQGSSQDLHQQQQQQQ